MIDIKVDNTNRDNTLRINVDSPTVNDLAYEASTIVFDVMAYALLKWGEDGYNDFKRLFLQWFDIKQNTITKRLGEIDKATDMMCWYGYLKRLVNFKENENAD